jgi:hypothetical protein
MKILLLMLLGALALKRVEAIDVNASTALETLSQQEMNELVNLHNRLRRSVGAANMAEISWDSSLALEAQNYANECPSESSKDLDQDLGESIDWATKHVSATGLRKQFITF